MIVNCLKYFKIISVFLIFFLFFCINLYGRETYTCEIIEYRNPEDPDRAGWIVSEEIGNHLIIHIGNTRTHYGDLFKRIHGRSLGWAAHLRLGDNYQAVLSSAHARCKKWREQNIPQEQAQKPVLKEMTVEQKHIDKDSVRVRITAKAEYPHIGNFSPNEIRFIINLGHERKWLNSSSPEVRRQNNNLYLDTYYIVNTPGNYLIRTVIEDTRFSSVAHSTIHFTSRLEQRISISKPVAVIKNIEGNAAIMRIDPTTSKGGKTVLSTGRYYPPKPPDILSAISPPDPDPYTTEQHRWELAEPGFLYEGDRVMLWGERDRSIIRPHSEPVTNEQIIEFLSSGISSIDIEWENGIIGRAIWNIREKTMNLSGSFIVGTSRETSGKWRNRWNTLFGETAEFIFEQVVGQVEGVGLDWLLQRKVSSMLTILSVFDLSAGSSIYEDLVYLNLKSHLYIRNNIDNLEIFTLEGNPEIVSDSQGNITVPQGTMASISDIKISEPRPFDVQDLLSDTKFIHDKPEISLKTDQPDILFSSWPLEYKLNIAISRLLEKVESTENIQQKMGYTKALEYLKLSQKHYNEFSEEGTGFPTAINQEECPYKIFHILRITAHHMHQTRVSWDHSPRDPRQDTNTIIKNTENINKALQYIKLCIDTMVESRAWNEYRLMHGMKIIAPPEFSEYHADNFDFALHVSDNTSQLKKLILLRNNDYPRPFNAFNYYEQNISLHQNRHSESDFHLLEPKGYIPGTGGYYIHYSYTYENRPITALIYYRFRVQIIQEIRYVAVTEHFDIEEAFEIIYSLYDI